MDFATQQKMDALGRLFDYKVRLNPKDNPFLYYLTDILALPHLSNIDPIKAAEFTELALKHETDPIVTDALSVLNKLIEPADGSMVLPHRDMFVENHHFTWKELGNYTKTTDVIMHIFNKTIFFMSIGKA